MKKGFNFSVIVFPSGETLNQELSFIKAAVLYADQVNLISPSIWNFLQRYQWAENLDRAEILNAFIKILEPRADQLDADQVLLSVVRSAHFRNQLKARLEKDELEKQLMNGMLSVTKSAYSAFIDRDYPEIMRLLRSNQLTIEEFTYPIEDYGIFSAEFFEKTRAAVTGATYPVLDEQTNGVLKSAAENRRIDLNESATKRVVHAQAADLILRRLPTFEKATLDELVDIKRALATPLARFRGKMLGFTDSIETRPWDADFAPDCDALYTKEVAPAIANEPFSPEPMAQGPGSARWCGKDGCGVGVARTGAAYLTLPRTFPRHHANPSQSGGLPGEKGSIFGQRLTTTRFWPTLGVNSRPTRTP